MINLTQKAIAQVKQLIKQDPNSENISGCSENFKSHRS